MQPAVDTFLKTVLKSGLLDREQLQSALRSVPRQDRSDPKGVAEHLITVGKLSRFQAQKLLQGTSRGLRLGPYQVQAPIGRGGMGAVYLALDGRDHRHVALKVLPPHRAREKEQHLARFLREMDMSRRVAHPHIALTFDAGVHEGVYYIAMEYIPGPSLFRLVSKGGPLEVGRAARLFAEVAAALDYAHGLGLIHRDLKPSNILVTPNGHAKVVDLGLALVQGETGEEPEVIGGRGYVVGSMDYVAPEQTEDARAVDARADIYSLGCALYFVLTGRPPFPGGTTRDKIRSHRFEEPPPLRELNPKVPKEFAALVERLMAKDPERRPQTAAAARAELLPWAVDEPELPPDRDDDSVYQMAVAALEASEAPAEGDDGVLLLGPESAVEAPSSGSSLVPLEFEPETNREYLWIVLGLLGFWGVVLAALGLLLWLR